MNGAHNTSPLFSNRYLRSGKVTEEGSQDFTLVTSKQIESFHSAETIFKGYVIMAQKLVRAMEQGVRK